MNILTLIPQRRALRYACFSDHGREAYAEGAVAISSNLSAGREAARALREIPRACRGPFAGVALRVPAAAPEFAQAVPATPEVIARLAQESSHAPLHLPMVCTLAQRGAEMLDAPVALLFETAFFAGLPARETGYALAPELSATLALRRNGYHGLFHEAACAWAAHHRHAGGVSDLRLLSVCLDAKSEIAAVRGGRPVMVTSGTTPLEGLPGELSCGELDPSIVMTLAGKMQCGPERVNTLLSEESGLSGLAGRRVTLAEVMRSTDAELALAREVMRYRILLASGAAMAALGGVDAIVFSGRYAELGELLGPWLVSRLGFSGAGAISWECFAEPLPRIMADAAWVTLRRQTAAGAMARG